MGKLLDRYKGMIKEAKAIEAKQSEAAQRATSYDSAFDAAKAGLAITPEDQRMVNAMIDSRFETGSAAIREQAGYLSDLLGTSAAARGVARGGIGLGQQRNLARVTLDQLGQLRGGLESAGFDQLNQMAANRANLALGIQGQNSNNYFNQQQLNMQRQQMRDQQGGGFGKLIGSIAGSFLGPVGAAAGGWLGNQITGGGNQPTYENSGVPFK